MPVASPWNWLLSCASGERYTKLCAENRSPTKQHGRQPAKVEICACSVYTPTRNIAHVNDQTLNTNHWCVWNYASVRSLTNCRAGLLFNVTTVTMVKDRNRNWLPAPCKNHACKTTPTARTPPLRSSIVVTMSISCRQQQADNKSSSRSDGVGALSLLIDARKHANITHERAACLWKARRTHNT